MSRSISITDVQHQSEKFEHYKEILWTWTCCCRFQRISTIVLIQAEEYYKDMFNFAKNKSTKESKLIGIHSNKSGKFGPSFLDSLQSSHMVLGSLICRFCGQGTSTQSRLSHMKMKSVQHLSIMAFVIHSLSSSSYYLLLPDLLALDSCNHKTKKKTNESTFFMRKKRKYFDEKCTCLSLSWARVCLSYILGTKMKRFFFGKKKMKRHMVLEGFIKNIRCQRGLIKE